ncbi:hypothetical protein [Micromonospora sp. MH33]|uniref:hypothetical protein n=1 Tax=Micromonospora sp. MH33 TaxID=1945509 RepID=UPI0011B23D28|nr:hypothetical protein [Micromonospora sp. MH33]
MPDLSLAAREQAVLSAVADAIVAAAVGRGLRAAVTCPEALLPYVGQLVRTLHARGLACRCVVSKHHSSDADSPSDHRASESVVAVITKPFAQHGDDVRRVNIEVTAGRPAGPGGVASQRCDGDQDTDNQPDIVLEYHDTEGLVIGRMVPYLSPCRC